MTYSYLTSVPLLMLYSITMTVIKYEEGYVQIPTVGVVPKPYQLWTHPQRTWVEAIYIAFSVAWALEIVSHLEELCFWLFLINVGAAQTSWFRSIHFKCWVLGSLLAITGLPIVAIFTRENPLKCEAWTIFVGSIGSLLITIWFLRVLWLFPAFLRRVKNEGAEPEVVVRLSTFHELNIIRVVFRFMFVLPLLTLAADGIKPDHNHVNESPFWTDLLAMLGAIGCIVSSIITLLIAGASNRAAATGGGVWERVGPEGGEGGTWEMVDYHQYQQHGVILPTVMPRRGSRRETALHPMVLNYTSPIDLIEGWDESDPKPTHY
ncbi:hypothetical protein FRC11_012604 [Ceratobasidium sp. 423]|nr:hypothetical protein FRC11_012604 [Ceratobasidium sp. 423]